MKRPTPRHDVFEEEMQNDEVAHLYRRLADEDTSEALVFDTYVGKNCQYALTRVPYGTYELELATTDSSCDFKATPSKMTIAFSRQQRTQEQNIKISGPEASPSKSNGKPIPASPSKPNGKPIPVSNSLTVFLENCQECRVLKLILVGPSGFYKGVDPFKKGQAG